MSMNKARQDADDVQLESITPRQSTTALHRSAFERAFNKLGPAPNIGDVLKTKNDKLLSKAALKTKDSPDLSNRISL